MTSCCDNQKVSKNREDEQKVGERVWDVQFRWVTPTFGPLVSPLEVSSSSSSSSEWCLFMLSNRRA